MSATRLIPFCSAFHCDATCVSLFAAVRRPEMLLLLYKAISCKNMLLPEITLFVMCVFYILQKGYLMRCRWGFVLNFINNEFQCFWSWRTTSFKCNFQSAVLFQSENVFVDSDKQVSGPLPLGSSHLFVPVENFVDMNCFNRKALMQSSAGADPASEVGDAFSNIW